MDMCFSGWSWGLTISGSTHHIRAITHLKGWSRDKIMLVNAVKTSLLSHIVTMTGNVMDWSKTGQKYKFVLTYDAIIQLDIHH